MRILLAVMALLSVFLTGCIGNTLPTAPSTPPTSEASKKEEALEGIGTICDIAQYGDGYLLLTHTGLYTLDKNLENRKSAGEIYERLFATEDNGGFFERLRDNPDYETPMFKNLAVLSDGIFFYCVSNHTSYLNGVPCGDEYECAVEEYQGRQYRWEFYQYADHATKENFYVGDKKLSARFENTFFLKDKIYVYNGISHEILKENGWGDLQECMRIYSLDGELLDTSTYHFGRFFRYLRNVEKTELEARGEFFEYERITNDFFGNVSFFATDDNYCYFLTSEVVAARWVEFDFGLEDDPTFQEKAVYEVAFKRFDGEKFEYLDCPDLSYALNYLRILILDDSHLLYLAEGGKPEITEFSVKQ